MTKFLLTSLIALLFLWNAPVARAQAVNVLGGEFSVSNKYVVVGDKVDVTFKAYTVDKLLLIADKTARLSIRNPKNGQSCETTDDNFKDDGKISGVCTAIGDAGNMEIGISMDGSDFSVGDLLYTSLITNTYNLTFNDASACQEGNPSPYGLTFQKQNDVTVEVKWAHSEKFVGTYDVRYGTAPDKLSSTRSTDQKTIIVDDLESNKAYYFKVQANSACKNTSNSNVYQYSSGSGAWEQVAPSPTPSPSVSPSPSATASATLASGSAQLTGKWATGSAKIASSSSLATDSAQASAAAERATPSPSPAVLGASTSVPSRAIPAFVKFLGMMAGAILLSSGGLAYKMRNWE